MLFATLADATSYVRFESLGLNKVALDLGFFQLRWYSLAYLAGIMLAYWYLLKLIKEPGSPFSRDNADDMIFYGTLGVILGGRLGYVLFYQPSILKNPMDIFKVWEGGMSLHGGTIGVLLGLAYFAWRNKKSFLRAVDYIAVTVGFGLLFGRLANFVNGELWGRATDVSWAIIFPTGGDVPRHPSQLYEAGLEGVLMLIIMYFMFWKTDARYKTGLLTGVAALIYGCSRFFVEYYRQPDKGLEDLSWGLTMGQTLSVPMIVLGLYLVLTANKRKVAKEAQPAVEAEA